MLSVYSCLVHEHDLRLVALAALVGVLGSWITVRLYVRAREDRSRRRMGWLFLAGVAAGGSIWSTHFVAMLGFETGTGVTFEPLRTGISFFVAILGSMIGFAISAYAKARRGIAVGGAVLGIAIATMHYVGMSGFEIDGIIVWDLSLVAASVLISVVLSIAALHHTNAPSHAYPMYGATVLMTLSIVSLHFTGMTALDVVPFEGAKSATEVKGAFALAISVGGVGLLIVGMGVSSYLIDQSVQTESNARLRHMAMFDDLTGLANRTQFSAILKQAIRQAESNKTQVAYAVIDLDGFKEINDGHGHTAGDAALKAIATRLTEALQSNETLARLGGDEFALLKPFTKELELEEFTDRVGNAFDGEVRFLDIESKLGGSIGVAVYPDDAKDAETLASFVDLAMYHAKSQLQTRICRFDPVLDATASRKRQMTADLRDAIENNDIYVLYQIQKNIETGATIGYEALARWRHPDFGDISPAEFIPLAEETGLILPLGRHVLLQACWDAAGWPENYKVSVNVSALQLVPDDLAIVIEDTLWKAQLPASRLQIEITETALVRHADETIAILHEIQSMGSTIAMDDFGTGYSSLASMRAFPFDVIKLDRGFICELEHSQQARDIVKAVIAICDSLDVAILAEGVETHAQRDFLLQAGCFAVQGYLFGKPVPAEQCVPDQQAMAS